MLEKQVWSVPVTCLAIVCLYYVSCLELFWHFYVCDRLLNMPPIQSTLRNKKLHSLIREVIYSVVNFMEYVLSDKIFTICAWKNSRSNRSFCVLLRKFNKGGKKINAGESCSSFQTSDQKCQHYRKPIHNIDDFNATVIRKTVYSFYKVEKWVPPVLSSW